MHEYSLTRALIEQVREIACQNNAEHVIEVVVDAGPLSGIEPLLMESAFEQLTANTELNEARLTIHHVPLTIRCDACGLSSSLSDFVFVCAHCKSPSVHVLSGDGVILRRVALGLVETNEVVHEN